MRCKLRIARKKARLWVNVSQFSLFSHQLRKKRRILRIACNCNSFFHLWHKQASINECKTAKANVSDTSSLVVLYFTCRREIRRFLTSPLVSSSISASRSRSWTDDQKITYTTVILHYFNYSHNDEVTINHASSYFITSWIYFIWSRLTLHIRLLQFIISC